LYHALSGIGIVGLEAQSAAVLSGSLTFRHGNCTEADPPADDMRKASHCNDCFLWRRAHQPGIPAVYTLGT
jgi:hypothetical protein